MTTPEILSQEETSSLSKARLATWQFIALLAVAFLFGLGAGYAIWAYPLQNKIASLEQTALLAQSTATAQAKNNAAASVAQPTDAQPTVAIPKTVKRYPVPVGNNPVLGSASAPITIIEFSDYECPFCRQWHTEVFPKLLQTYGDKIRFVYRDLPIDKHLNAAPAAEAADCAGEQSKYYEFHNLAFEGNDLSAVTLESYASKLGLKMDQFKECVSSHRFQSEVKADYDFASNLGVQSTPTFFINGLAVVGAQPFEVFQQIIDLELAGKIPQ